ncbi:phosphotransferase, partial [Lysinibacillus xylanilyticus]|nr:phosphotransferase [Lysinibacillus xylanilyticus]
MLIESVIDHISSLKGYSSIKKVEKGYSPDKKYIVTVGQNQYFIRLSDIQYHEKRTIEFSLLQALEKQGVQTYKAIECTLLNEDNLSVMVLSYIEGYPADEFISSLSDVEQFNIGISAGKELRKIHQLHAHAPQTIHWEEAQRKKFSFYLNEYKKGSYQLPKEHKILNFIENNFHILEERPITLLH